MVVHTFVTLWPRCLDAFASVSQRPVSLAPVRKRNRIIFFMATTDKGPNEAYARKLVQVRMRSVPNFFYLTNDCLEHQSHLGILGALQLCDALLKQRRSWKFFSSLAIIATTLRDLSQDLFSAWTHLYGASSAVEKVKSLFPRCISGRWGSVNETEERLLKTDIKMLRDAVKFMFEKNPFLMENDKVKGKKGDDDACVDTLSLESTKLFRVRMGKWRRQTWEVLQDALFEMVVVAMHRLHQPWIHLSNFLKQKLPESSEGHLHALVCGKAQEIFSQFSDMMFRSLSRPSSKLQQLLQVSLIFPNSKTLTQFPSFQNWWYI